MVKDGFKKLRHGNRIASYQRFWCKGCGHIFVPAKPNASKYDSTAFNAQVACEYLLNRSLRKVRTSKAVGKISKDTILETVIAVSGKLPDTSELNRRLEIRWSGRYILDGVFFKYQGKGLVLLLLADAESLDLIDYLLAEAENYQSWKLFVQRVKPEIEADGKLEKFFVSDGKKGLHQALKELFPKVPRQLCISHKQRRISSIIPQIYGNSWDKLFGHLGHKAIGAKSESAYWVYLSLLKEFTKPAIFARIPEPEQRKLKQVIGVLKFQRHELHAQFEHPDLIGKDTTSNILEGINGFLKERLKLMRGLKKENHVPKIIKLLIYYYRFHPFVASNFKQRNGKSPIELNRNINQEKIRKLLKGRRPYSWIVNLLLST